GTTTRTEPSPLKTGTAPGASLELLDARTSIPPDRLSLRPEPGRFAGLRGNNNSNRTEPPEDGDGPRSFPGAAGRANFNPTGPTLAAPGTGAVRRSPGGNVDYSFFDRHAVRHTTDSGQAYLAVPGHIIEDAIRNNVRVSRHYSVSVLITSGLGVPPTLNQIGDGVVPAHANIVPNCVLNDVPRHHSVSDLIQGGGNTQAARDQNGGAFYVRADALRMLDAATDRLQEQRPGATFQIASIWRGPWRNSEGEQFSFRHALGYAIDVIPPSGVTMQETAAMFRTAGARSAGVYTSGRSAGMVHVDTHPAGNVWGTNGRSASAPAWLQRMYA
ncbi:MAG: hypothetical protein AAFQ82_23500, partial [Myxococcota bacterium]